MLPLSREVIQAEIDLAQRILKKWEERFSQGVPNVDLPGSEDAQAFFIQECCGEMALVSGKLERLAAILSGQGY